MANKNNDKEIYCSFCGKPQDMVSRLIAGSGAYICDRCVELCMNIIEQSGEVERDRDREYSPSAPEMSEEDFAALLKPKEIKAILDEYVIGQDDAKIALSVAVYNHYKRLMQRGAADEVEIEKSNIIMVGSTGTGNTVEGFVPPVVGFYLQPLHRRRTILHQRHLFFACKSFYKVVCAFFRRQRRILVGVNTIFSGDVRLHIG